MKLSNFITAMFTIALLLFTSCMFAQSDVVVTPDDGVDIAGLLQTFGTFVALTIVVTEFVLVKLNITGIVSQIVSWGISIVLAVVAYFLSLGMFADMTLLSALVTGFFASLAANGIADTGLVQSILALIKFPTKVPTK